MDDISEGARLSQPTKVDEGANSMSTVRFVWLNQRLSHDLASRGVLGGFPLENLISIYIN